jgi:hypothetical protein
VNEEHDELLQDWRMHLYGKEPFRDEIQEVWEELQHVHHGNVLQFSWNVWEDHDEDFHTGQRRDDVLEVVSHRVTIDVDVSMSFSECPDVLHAPTEEYSMGSTRDFDMFFVYDEPYKGKKEGIWGAHSRTWTGNFEEEQILSLSCLPLSPSEQILSAFAHSPG